MTTLHGWGLPEQHLALDALVAFVDGELTPCAYDRAAAHIARCQTCAAEATVQRNARTAVQSADTPSMSPQLLRALQSIPSEAELPGQPDELALAENGQLVTVNRNERSTRFGTGAVLGSSTPLGASTPLGGSQPAQDEATQTADHPGADRHHGRRTRQGAGVVFSGLVLGALALINLPVEDQRAPGNVGPRSPQPADAYSNGTTPASNDTSRPEVRPPMQPQVAAQTSILPSENVGPTGP